MELDPRNAAIAQQAATTAGLSQVEVMTADAALTDCYQGMAPADLVLACGIFGNITDEDIERTVDYCSQLCDTGTTIIWTRHRGASDRVPLIFGWFEKRGLSGDGCRTRRRGSASACTASRVGRSPWPSVNACLPSLAMTGSEERAPT
ncbi:hypothetical protein [Nonomuraea dietziae]|uniref:hypothetical protein n=1 Tax=Nonomuraea dietziae TaxID=65515 RepID=UPI00342B389F